MIEEAGTLTAQAAQPISDIRGSADYRDYMIGVITKRALTAIMNGGDKGLYLMNRCS